MQLIGDTTTPANFVFSLTSGTAILVTAGAQLAIKGFKVVDSGGAGLYSELGGSVIAVNGNMTYGSGAPSIWADRGGGIEITSNYTIVSGSNNYHWHAAFHGRIIAFGLTATLTGTPNYTIAFAGADNFGEIFCSGNTYSGAATGSSYTVTANGVINSGVTLPGNAAGTTASGGQYL
ncbi:MAG: hypothetical protein NVSMB26_09430 [Beijerinckiaceae bacterium]